MEGGIRLRAALIRTAFAQKPPTRGGFFHGLQVDRTFLNDEHPIFGARFERLGVKEIMQEVVARGMGLGSH